MADKVPNKKIADKLTIEAAWVGGDHQSDPDRATAAAITISLDATTLTDAYDSFQQKACPSAQLSAYPLAEWLAWNWWRLRWEPFKESVDWRLAHKLSSIGSGFIWPNISIYSDGQHLIVDTRATEPKSSEPLRYVKNDIRELKPRGFETGVDNFIESVFQQLKDEGIAEANLFNIWNDVRAERENPKLAEYRKIEAILGFDPEDADKHLIQRILDDASVLGRLGVSELAAVSNGRPPPSKDEISEWARTLGVKRDPRNAIKLADKSEDALPSGVEAWRRGKSAARALRSQVGAGESPISTRDLLEMIGSSAGKLEYFKSGAPISFELDENVARSTVVLRESVHEDTHRFDLARLIGDNVAHPDFDGRLTPITSSFTYRQKMQRAFAAEFLSPFNAVDRMMEGDYYDDEAVERVAAHFKVSALSVKASLANNQKIHRHDVWVS